MPIGASRASSSTMNAEVDHIIEAFKSWDESGTGVISREDLSSIIRALSPGIGDDDLDKLFTAAASDGLPGNHLKYEDFVTWLWLPTPVDKVAAPNLGAKESAPAKKQAPASSSSAPAPAPAFDPADEERRRRGLWQGALKDAVEKGSRKYPEDKVQRYFDEVQKRLSGEEYGEHVRGKVFPQVDSDRDGKISFKQVTSIIGKSLQCANDMGTGAKITMQEIRAAFDAHDTFQTGRGVMEVDEFLNLMRYLQVRVAEAAMPMSRVLKEA